MLLLALFFSLSPFSDKAKTRVMYVGAVVSLALIPIMYLLGGITSYL